MNLSEEVSSGATGTSQRASTTALTFLVVLLVVSVTLNVLLARKIRNLGNAEIAKMNERLLERGATVPAITGNRLGGQSETVSYEGTNQVTVLYIFTPSCSWCARNLDGFKALIDQEGSQYRFVGLSLSEEGLAQYVAKSELKLPVYSGLSTAAKERYKLSGTPQTIVISPEGRVLQNWVGAYVGVQKSQVEEFFKVTLPGIRPTP